MSGYPLVALNQVLMLKTDEVGVEPDRVYRPAGIYSFGRGLFEKPSFAGTETTYSKLTRLHENQFVYSRLFAWEGAFAIVTPPFETLFVSPEFPTFDIRRDIADPEYLKWICRWPYFWHQMQTLTKGLGVRRKRVHAEHVLVTQIPLPSLPEQARIATWLDTIDQRLATVTAGTQLVGSQIRALYPALVSEVLDQDQGLDIPLRDLVAPISETYRPGDDPAPATEFVGMEHIESHTGRRIGATPVGDERGSKKRFAPGDIVYGKLRPYLNKVWVADRCGLCSVDQTVLRPHDIALSQLIANGILSSRFLAGVIELTREAQLPRIRQEQLLDLPIRIPSARHRAQISTELEQLSHKAQRLLTLHASRSRLTHAIIPSALNHVLSGNTS